jgi:hypothetical protein
MEKERYVMTTSRAKRLLGRLVGLMALLPILAGCSGKAPELTKQEQNEFKGGPMPEEARKIMQQKMREAQEKNKAANPSPGAPPP